MYNFWHGRILGLSSLERALQCLLKEGEDKYVDVGFLPELGRPRRRIFTYTLANSGLIRCVVPNGGGRLTCTLLFLIKIALILAYLAGLVSTHG